MKKYLFIILLSLICIIPFNVKAEETKYLNYYLYPSGLTSEQKLIFKDLVLNDSNFINYSKAYPYYFITYHNKTIPYQYNYPNLILVVFLNEIPELTNTFDQYMDIPSSSISKIISYVADLNSNTISINNPNQSVASIKIFNHNPDYSVSIGTTSTYLTSYLDYYLYANFELKPLWNANVYDLDGKLINSYTIEDNLFNFEVEEKEYTIEDILNSEDVLYSLSKELIGTLPEEFHFIYSVVSLMLAILVLIVIISPFVILKRWLM